MSNNYEDWVKQQPQFALKMAIDNNINDVNILRSSANLYPEILKPEAPIVNVYNALKSAAAGVMNPDLSLPATGLNTANKIAEFKKLIMQVLHIVSKNKTPANVAAGNPSNLKFRISANDDVDVIDENGKVVATAYHHNNIDANTFSMCDDVTKVPAGATQNACRKHLAFVAGVYNDVASKRNAAGDLDNFFGYGFETAGDQDVNKIANAFSWLRRIGWWRYDDDSGVYKLEDFTKDLRSKPEVVEMLKPLFGNGRDDVRLARELENTLDNDWTTFIAGADPVVNLNDFGKLIVKCIVIINKNPGILKAQVEAQHFAVKNTGSRFMGRIAALDAAGQYSNQLSDVWRPQNGVARILIGRRGQTGGGGIEHSGLYRNKLDEAVTNLARNGKRLSASTMSKFESKFNKLAAAEREITAFIANVKKVNGALESGDANAINLDRNISDEDIEKFTRASNDVSAATYVLETGISNINLKMVQQKAPAQRTAPNRL